MTYKIKNIGFNISAELKILIFLVSITFVSFSQYNYEKNPGHEIKKGNLTIVKAKLSGNPQDDGSKMLNKFNHQFSLSLSGGFLLPLGDLKGDINGLPVSNRVTNAQSYYEKMGYSYGISAKMKTDKRNRFRVTMSLIINNFLNSGSDSTGTVTVEPELNFMQMGVGGEYAFTQFGDFVPFIGVELNASSFFGQKNFIDDSTGSSYSLKYSPETRYGAAIGAGTDYYLSSSWGIFGGVKFSVSNLLGKSSDAGNQHSLNDEKFTLHGTEIKQKTIMHLAFYAGFTVFIGD